MKQITYWKRGGLIGAIVSIVFLLLLHWLIAEFDNIYLSEYIQTYISTILYSLLLVFVPAVVIGAASGYLYDKLKERIK